jgi:hypothetical protein
MDELTKRIKLEALITKREAMIAENKWNTMYGNYPPYRDDSFNELKIEIEALNSVEE